MKPTTQESWPRGQTQESWPDGQISCGSTNGGPEGAGASCRPRAARRSRRLRHGAARSGEGDERSDHAGSRRREMGFETQGITRNVDNQRPSGRARLNDKCRRQRQAQLVGVASRREIPMHAATKRGVRRSSDIDPKRGAAAETLKQPGLGGQRLSRRREHRTDGKPQPASRRGTVSGGRDGATRHDETDRRKWPPTGIIAGTERRLAGEHEDKGRREPGDGQPVTVGGRTHSGGRSEGTERGHPERRGRRLAGRGRTTGAADDYHGQYPEKRTRRQGRQERHGTEQ